MEKLIIGLLLLISVNVSAQTDTSKYYESKDYGWIQQRFYPKKVLLLPRDTTFSKYGLADKGGVLYHGNGNYWTEIGSGSSTTPPLQQVTAQGRATTYGVQVNSDTAGLRTYNLAGQLTTSLFSNSGKGTLQLHNTTSNYNAITSRATAKRTNHLPDSSGTVALQEYTASTSALSDTAAAIRAAVGGNKVDSVVSRLDTLRYFVNGDSTFIANFGVKPDLQGALNNGSELTSDYTNIVAGVTNSYFGFEAFGEFQVNADVITHSSLFGFYGALDSLTITTPQLRLNIPSAGASKVLTSDANGLATWQTPTTTDTTSLSNRINTKLNTSDSTIYQPKFRSDTARTNIYTNIAARAALSGATFTGSVGIGTSPDASAILDVSSTTKGLLIPRVTTTQMNAISSPVDGLQVYNTTEKSVYFYNSDWGWESDALSYKRKFGVEYFNELTTATPSDGIIVGSLSNGGTITALSGVASRTGIQAPSTSTNAAARYTISTDATALVLGQGRVLFEESVRIPTLSNATDAFYHFFGLSAQITASAQTNGVLFLYDSSGTVTGSAASGRWQVMTASASSRTFTTTSIQVTANQWYKLTGIVNAAGTSVQFYIDDVLVATHTTNIPTAAMGFVSNLQKSAGTTARTTNLDYLYFKQKYTTSR